MAVLRAFQMSLPFQKDISRLSIGRLTKDVGAIFQSQ
jgi:hypothetical protein